METLEHQQPQAFPPTPSGFRLWGESGALNLPLRSHAGREEGVHRGPFSPGDLGTALRAAGGCGFALAPARDGAQRGRTAAVGRNHPTDGHGSGFIFWQRSRPNPPAGTGSPGCGGQRLPCPMTTSTGSPAQLHRHSPAPSTRPQQRDPRPDAPARLPAASPTLRGSRLQLCRPLPAHSMATGGCPSTSRVLEFSSSLRISSEICGWLWNLSSSSKASFCSEERSSL